MEHITGQQFYNLQKAEKYDWRKMEAAKKIITKEAYRDYRNIKLKTEYPEPNIKDDTMAKRAYEYLQKENGPITYGALKASEEIHRTITDTIPPCGLEPYYSQIIGRMVAWGQIKRVKHGMYSKL